VEQGGEHGRASASVPELESKSVERSLAGVAARAERPIFVVGFKRSGTTLLQSLIGSHERIAASPETYFIFRVANQHQSYGDLDDDENLKRAVHDALDAPGGSLDSCNFDERAVYERARTYERTMRGVMSAMMDDFATREGKPRWTEKSPGQRAGGILALFPDAQIIHIVRDPRDIIASALALPWNRQSAFDLAGRWREFTTANTRAGLAAGPSSFLQVRYEDLSRDPEATMRVVFAFLGELFDPALVSDLSRRETAITLDVPWQTRVREPVQPVAEGGWRSKLRGGQARVVQAHLHREIALLGYQRAPRRDVAIGTAMVVRARLAQRFRARLSRLRPGRTTNVEALQDFLDWHAGNLQAASAGQRTPSASD
jgi:hypothetical protein